MSYQIRILSGRIEKSFHKILDNLSEDQRNKTEQNLSEDPKGTAATHWTIKKVRKDAWQMDLPHGYRLIYTVLDKNKLVLIRFVGNHDAAAAYLRGKK